MITAAIPSRSSRDRYSSQRKLTMTVRLASDRPTGGCNGAERSESYERSVRRDDPCGPLGEGGISDYRGATRRTTIGRIRLSRGRYEAVRSGTIGAGSVSPVRQSGGTPVAVGTACGDSRRNCTDRRCTSSIWRAHRGCRSF